MTDRGIIFSGPMVRALLAGRKTQTRRKLRPQPETVVDGRWAYAATQPGHSRRVRTPEAGDRLWVRERHRFRGATYLSDSDPEPEWFRVHGSGGAGDNWDPDFPAGWAPARYYDATEAAEQEDSATTHLTSWISPIHMPRWASRLTLAVTDVRVQRLQDISEADALSEGVRLMRDGGGTFVGREGPGAMVTPWPTAAEAYADIWNSIHGPAAWDANPWVAAISFTVERRNIDAPATREAALA